MVTRAEISAAISAICMFTVHTSGVSATKFGVILAVTKITKTSHALPVLTVLAGEVSAIKEGVILIGAEIFAAIATKGVVTVLTGKVAACKLIVLSTLTSRMSAGVKRVVKAAAKILAAALTE